MAVFRCAGFFCSAGRIAAIALLMAMTFMRSVIFVSQKSPAGCYIIYDAH